MADFTLSPLAKSDLQHIGRFTQKRWGVSQRNHYLDLLLKAFFTLAHEPILGRPRSDIHAGVLSYLCASHVIYFRRQSGCVEILRILHQRMDAKAHF